MPSVIEQRTDPWVDQEGIRADSAEEEEAGRQSAEAVIRRVNEILGYDIFEVQLMAQGYLELGEENLVISESNLAAGFEALPAD